MGDAALSQKLSAAEFLEWESAQFEKHEFHLGEVFAMAGGSPRHNFLSGTMVAQLWTALRGKGCHVFTSDQRIATKEGERYVYPDAGATCGKQELEAGTSDVLTNPKIVVEVLSKSTQAYDRGEKWDAYQRIPSLSDYLLVSQSAPQIEHFQREEDGSWRYRRLGLGDRVVLRSGAVLSVDAVYEGAFELTGDG